MRSRLLDEWPLDEGDLAPAEREKLARKLAGSPELQEQVGAWQAIEASLRKEPSVGPPPGFVGRWQANLTARRARRWRRQVRGLLGLLLMGAFATSLLIGLDTLSSLGQLGSSLLGAAIQIGEILETGAQYLSVLGDGWPARFGVLALSAALAWLSVLWAAAMYRYAFGQVQNGV